MGSVASYNASLYHYRGEEYKKGLLHVGTDIYYEGFEDEDEDDGSGSINDDTKEFVITQEFIDSLKLGDRLVLEGSGSCR